MTCRNLLSQISDTLLDEFQNAHSGILKEEHPLATCKEVEIEYKDSIILIYKFDVLPGGISRLFAFFKQGSTHNQMCDYIIFYPKKEKLFVVLCNLKSKNFSNSHSQILNGYIFSKFIVEIASSSINISSIPDFVKFKAVHFTSLPGTKKIATNPRKIRYEHYKNGLEYIIHPCKSKFYLDNICSDES